MFGHILPLLCFFFFAVARTTKYSGNKGLDTQDIVGILRAIKMYTTPLDIALHRCATS